MSMMDYLYVEIGFCCADGHKIHNFQTRDLNNLCDYFYLCDKLYVVDRSLRDTLRRHDEWPHREPDAGPRLVPKGKKLKIYQPHAVAVLAGNVTKAVVVYAACTQCRPVLTIHTESRWRDEPSVNEHHPLVEYVLTFADGVLGKVERGPGFETRRKVRKALVEQGSRVLTDREERLLAALKAKRGED